MIPLLGSAGIEAENGRKAMGRRYATLAYSWLACPGVRLRRLPEVIQCA
jgi:hypothetical protein